MKYIIFRNIDCIDPNSWDRFHWLFLYSFTIRLIHQETSF